ncbi:hypothetical protein E4U56_000213 [Claviceps arundinis]|uniref:Septin-type G domain-containing protein n=1 Tax=Claviceps arundinis TaxID=1623583 RepID=A0A9P7MU57_9HYPO|nr:hypothetical protein E4U56_000213 [Claviceps arundinis]
MVSRTVRGLGKQHDMRSAHAAADISCTRQLHDVLDTTSQAAPIAPLACFITTESALYHDHGSGEKDGSNMPSQSRKQHAHASTQESECSSEQSELGHPPSISQSNQGAPSPFSTPVKPAAFRPDSIGSDPSSPGDTSSFTMSEDPRCLSPNFSELPRRSSPGLSQAVSGLAEAPQLVMPSLMVPRRRSFSETGKSLGKLKILVTGQAGIGKKSLILAIAQSCTHIVHMDSMQSARKNTPRITYASTRPRPWWRAYQGQKLAKRRPSILPDEVLDRNICFVDCNAHTGSSETSFPAVEYVESQLAHLLHSPIDDVNLCALLSGDTEPNVDVVLYLLSSKGPSFLDIGCMKKLQQKTNVIPLLALADHIPIDQLGATKQRISQQLKVADIDCFSFSQASSDLESPSVYAISSVTRLDYDTIDASILMASDYQPPLLRTDLDSLVTDIMSVDGSSWLRHSAASRAVYWLRKSGQKKSLPYSSLIYRPLHSKASPFSTSLTSAHLDEQYWGKMEVSSWAETLRESLTLERLNLFQQQSEVHLADDYLVTMRTDCSQPRLRCYRQSYGASSMSSNQDPLGLLELASRIRGGGKLTLELLSTFGIFGCLVALIVRPELSHQWNLILTGPPRCF